jgi:regulator of protease activity HflC (stomatin/prohibitin superfamily)
MANAYDVEMKKETRLTWMWSSILLLILIGITVGLMAILPNYRVWQRELKGKAALKEAQWDRQIQVEEAQANLESEKLNAQAEIERAKGVAESNRIIGEGLKDNEEYLRYLWIKGLNDGSSEVIYVPTEANLPILEATRKYK